MRDSGASFNQDIVQLDVPVKHSFGVDIDESIYLLTVTLASSYCSISLGLESTRVLQGSGL